MDYYQDIDTDIDTSSTSSKQILSGNTQIDTFIKEVNEYEKYFEWIPFELFKNVKQIGQGGFSTIYYAERIDNGMRVALKGIHDSQNISEEFLSKIYSYVECSTSNSNILPIYGLTQNPNSNILMIVYKFAQYQNLQKFLKMKFTTVYWHKKLNWLLEILKSIDHIHNLGYVHGNLHSGNILMNNNTLKSISCYVSDACNISNGPIIINNDNNDNNDDDDDKKGCYGVLPYMAPEILIGKEYTKNSDIYSFGILMIELATGFPPFYDKPHNHELAKEIIINDLRPNYVHLLEIIPKEYNDLMKKCLSKDPIKRPSTNDLIKIIKGWTKEMNKPTSQIKKNFDLADDYINSDFVKNQIKNIEINSLAIYTSRYLYFEN